MEQLPSHLFDHIGKTAFAKLPAPLQQELTQYMSEAEYNMLHEAALAAQQLYAPLAAGTDSVGLDALLKHYDNKHRAQPAWQVLSRPVSLWKAAAAVLLLCFGGWQYLRLAKPAAPAKLAMAVHDTVFITHEIQAAPVKLHDTVFITRNETPRRQQVHNMYPEKPAQVAVTQDEAGNMHILRMESLQEPRNRQKDNDSRYDSLTERIGFVTL